MINLLKSHLRFAIRCSVLASLVAVAGFAQDFKPANATNAQAFLGTWQASFHGKPFMTLTIKPGENKLTGTMTGADIDVDKQGELTKAEASDSVDAITDARVNGDRLRITSKSSDGSEETMDAELKLVSPDALEMRFLGIPPDVPAPKPWKMVKVEKRE